MKRRVLLAFPPLAALASRAPAALGPTPGQTAGPFYPTVPPEDDDSDLVRVAGHPRRAKGTLLHLTGRVLRADGTPVAGARVEIWQCDANGRYHHPRDRGNVPADPGFQGFGHSVSGVDGGYRFRTIRPVAYPGRTPHIHFAVRAPGAPPLVTQMYVHGESRNQRDFLYGRIPGNLRERVTVLLEPDAAEPTALSGRFDLVLAV